MIRKLASSFRCPRSPLRFDLTHISPDLTATALHDFSAACAFTSVITATKQFLLLAHSAALHAKDFASFLGPFLHATHSARCSRRAYFAARMITLNARHALDIYITRGAARHALTLAILFIRHVPRDDTAAWRAPIRRRRIAALYSPSLFPPVRAEALVQHGVDFDGYDYGALASNAPISPDSRLVDIMISF